MGRKRYLNKQSLDAARTALLGAAQRLESSERVPAEQALGRITAEAVHARASVPHYHGAAMDGIALRAEDTFGASEGHALTLTLGMPETAQRPFAYVDTGNALPPWANAVVMIERVFSGPGPGPAPDVGAERQSQSMPAVRADDGCCDSPEPHQHAGSVPDLAAPGVEGTAEMIVHIRAAAAPWQHVRLVGEDIVTSESLLPRGHRIRPYDVGALLAVGVHEVAVRPRPVVAILPTGDELIEPGDELRPGRIVEFNSRMIGAFVREWGGEPLRLPPVRDDLEAIHATIRAALGQADVVCVIAGSSAGERDFTVEALARVGVILAHGIDIMPGKPAIVAAISRDRLGEDAPAPRASVALGIPGYPVSAAIVCRELLEPLLLHLLGGGVPARPTVRAIVPRKLPSKLGQEEFVRVTLGRVADRLIVSPLGRGAGAISTMVRADGFVRVPPLVEGLNAGEEVEVELLRPLREVLDTIVVTGSHDLALGMLEDALKASHPQYKLATSSVGSLAGLLALGRGEAHLAASHLLDPASGTYNLSDIARLLEGTPLEVVNLVVRMQGLIVQPGNPLGLAGIVDLARPGVRFVNRQSGAGTRVLLDHLLERASIDPDRIAGYEREELTHMAVAVAVRSGLADVGLGVESAAAALGLDFVPIEREDYDLVLRQDFASSEPGQALLDTIRGSRFRTAIARLPGYETERTGTAKPL